MPGFRVYIMRARGEEVCVYGDVVSLSFKHDSKMSKCFYKRYLPSYGSWTQEVLRRDRCSPSSPSECDALPQIFVHQMSPCSRLHEVSCKSLCNTLQTTPHCNTLNTNCIRVVLKKSSHWPSFPAPCVPAQHVGRRLQVTS